MELPYKKSPLELPGTASKDIYAFAQQPRLYTDGTTVSLQHGLDQALYKSQWAIAKRWLQEQCLVEVGNEASLAALLQAGAKAYGLDWALSPLTVAPLLAVVRDDDASFEAAQAALASLSWPPSILGASIAPFASSASSTTERLPLKPLLKHTGEPVSAASRRRRLLRMKVLSVVLTALLLGAAGKLIYVVLIEIFPDFWSPLTRVFGWGIIIARVTAFGTLLCTAVLFLTMSRGLHRGILACCTRLCVRSRILRALADGTKELHVVSAAAMVVLAFVHTSAHVVWDLPMMLTTDTTRLNAALKCGICDRNTICRLTLPRALEWPPCPFEAALTVGQLLRSTTVITGILLWLVLLAMWATAHRTARAARYDIFWLAHNALLASWVVLLWLHASNQWAGVAFPLALWMVVPPAAVYYLGRARRAWLVCVATAHEQPPTVVFQLAPDDAAGETSAHRSQGSLLPLPVAQRGELIRLTLPVSEQFGRQCRPGMYALLNVPDLSSWQWHPFTIASFDGVANGSTEPQASVAVASTACAGASAGAGGNASTDIEESATPPRHLLAELLQVPRASFIIEVAGDWTAQLVSACKQAHLRRGRNAMPRVVVDGPFAAPAQSALRCPVIFAVGAGVGITPFLSLVETLAEREHSAAAGHHSSGLLEARCYWIARSAEAFLFGWPLLRKLLAHAQLRARIVFHLHVTARVPEDNGAAYLFRQAVVRQNARLFTPQPQLASGGVSHAAAEAKADVLFVAMDDVSGGGGSDGGGVWPSTGVRVHFGRPDFESDLLALAARHPSYDVNVYVCGGDPLVESLTGACEASERAVRDSTQQRFRLAHERFG